MKKVFILMVMAMVLVMGCEKKTEDYSYLIETSEKVYFSDYEEDPSFLQVVGHQNDVTYIVYTDIKHLVVVDAFCELIEEGDGYFIIEVSKWEGHFNSIILIKKDGE